MSATTALVPLYSALFFLPLRLGVEDARRPLGQPGEVHLDRREGLGLAVAQDADVELPALDVLLGQGRSLTFSWMAMTRSISSWVSRTSALASMPIEASVRSGLTKSGIRRLPPVSKSVSRRRRRSPGSGSCRRRGASWSGPCPPRVELPGRRPCRGYQQLEHARHADSPPTFLPNISMRLKTRSGFRRLRPAMSFLRSPWTPRIETSCSR